MIIVSIAVLVLKIGKERWTLPLSEDKTWLLQVKVSLNHQFDPFSITLFLALDKLEITKTHISDYCLHGLTVLPA